MLFKRDFFLQKHLNVNCYITNLKNSFKSLNKIKKPFFFSYINKTKLSQKEQSRYNCKYISKLLIFKKKFKKKEILINNCRLAKNLDKKLIDKLILKSNTNSRFYLDENINKKKIKRFRADWVAEYFRNKKGKKLILCEIKNKIGGILLLSHKGNIARIDILVVDPKFIRKSIASSLVSFVNNKYNARINFLIAGTQQSNNSAIKFYKKNNFKLIDFKYYHHIYSKQ